MMIGRNANHGLQTADRYPLYEDKQVWLAKYPRPLSARILACDAKTCKVLLHKTRRIQRVRTDRVFAELARLQKWLGV